MRRFGTEALDLEVDFAAPLPFVVTELLCRCAQLDADAAWDLAVGTRTEMLAGIASLTSGALTVTLRCVDAHCREALEVEISPGELRAWCSFTERDSANVEVNGHQARVRRPTGRDQRVWLDTAWPDADAARRGMLTSLMSSLPLALDEGAIGAIEAELERIDPLVGFSLTVACPACGASASHTVDLDKSALQLLRRTQERLLETVVGLATRFHWTEADIFALPAWRRERYLALAEAGR
jgi:hypothetical protein